MQQFELEAACACRTGRLRNNNEDNFLFDGRCLEEENRGLRHPVTMTDRLQKEICFAVFDGMGEADFGETAAFTAAEGLRSMLTKLDSFFVPERHFLQDSCAELNDAVLRKKEELRTERMGTTMTALMFSPSLIYVCNMGDSRAYRLRNGEFLQLTKDHVLVGEGEKKGVLTQYLGMDPQPKGPEPFIARGEIRDDDWYILCSDGLTDSLTNLEIDFAVLQSGDPENCVRTLMDKALSSGGQDDITVIAIHITDARGSDSPSA